MIAALALPVSASASVDTVALNAYARARLADGEGALVLAVSSYRQALDNDPANPLVAMRSYRQAMQSGDMALALSSARVLDSAGALPRDGTLLLAVDSLLHKNWIVARQMSRRLEKEENFGFVAPILDSWISTVDGPYAPPAADPARRFGVLTERYIDEHLAFQLLNAENVKVALPEVVQTLSQATNPLIGLRLAFAVRLALLGDKEAALACIAGDISPFPAARADISRGVFPGSRPLTPAQGFARLLARLSDDISSAEARPVALTLARLATFADPASAEFRVELARQLNAVGHAEAAMEESGRVPAKSWFALNALDVEIDALVAADRREAALALARKTVKRPDAGAAEQLRLANILADSKQFQAAADAYRTARAFYPADSAPWTLYLLEGSALERGGQWDLARPELEKAAALAPNEPVALNYLGYAQVERRQNVKSALMLLEKASALRPDDPSITDSLGWARYISGDAHAAVPVLERAAAGAPGDMTINEHLGDALWVTGRRYEARYAWAAAGNVAEGKDADRIGRKVREGLDADLATP